MHYLTLCAAQPPVSNNEPEGTISLFSLLSFSNKGKQGSLAHKFAGGGGGEGEDYDVDQASFKQVSPCREANDRKAKLPKFEQSVLKF